MQPSDFRIFGRSGLKVTTFACGTAPVGNLFRPIDDATSDAMFQTAWEAGIRFYDTAPMYGHGLAELRTSENLRWKRRDDFVLSSKVGRRLVPAKRETIDFTPWTQGAPFKMEFDYTYDGTMRTFEDSLQRLALERMDIVFIHDIDVFTRGKDQPEVFKQAMDGCYKALERLRDEKVVTAIGVGVNEWEVCHEALKQRDFDCFLLAGRYTLLEQMSLDFLALCHQRGIGLLLGGVYNTGILVTGAVPGARYQYAEAPVAILDKTRAIEAICARHGVALAAAAQQFVLAHPAVAAVVVGAVAPEEVRANVAAFSATIPAAFWTDLRDAGLIDAAAPLP